MCRYFFVHTHTGTPLTASFRFTNIRNKNTMDRGKNSLPINNEGKNRAIILAFKSFGNKRYTHIKNYAFKLFLSFSISLGTVIAKIFECEKNS